MEGIWGLDWKLTHEKKNKWIRIGPRRSVRIKVKLKSLNCVEDKDGHVITEVHEAHVMPIKGETETYNFVCDGT